MKDGDKSKEQFIKELSELRQRIAELEASEAEQKQTEKAFRKEKVFSTTIVQASPAFFVTIGGDGKTIMMNESMLQTLGYTLDEVAGKDYLSNFVPEEDRKLLSKVFETLVVSHEATVNENRVLARDGQKLLVEWHGKQIFKPDGDFDYFFGIGIDITERRRVEKALRESERRLADIIDFLPDATFAIDLEGRVVAWNRAIEEMTGVKAEDMLGKGNHEHALPFYGARRPILIDLVFKPDKEIERKYSFIRREKDCLIVETDVPFVKGRNLHLWGKASPVYDYKGNAIGAIESIRDTTDRKRTEEELRKYREHLEEMVQERTAELQQFTYIVSHDLRAPLVNLKGFASELRSAMEVIQPAFSQYSPYLSDEKRKEIGAALEEDVPEALGFIDSSATRMDRLIGSILKLSRIGHRDLDFEPVNMNDLVGNLLHTMAHQIEESRANIKVASLPEAVADRTSMEHIMGNILENAVKYLAPNHRGEIEVWGEKKEGFVIFHIRDNGRGISKSDLPKVFEIFRRGGKRDVPGEGMGLAYVQTLVRRHGGQIRCESEAGTGTTFTFTISNYHTKGVNNGL